MSSFASIKLTREIIEEMLKNFATIIIPCMLTWEAQRRSFFFCWCFSGFSDEILIFFRIANDCASSYDNVSSKTFLIITKLKINMLQEIFLRSWFFWVLLKFSAVSNSLVSSCIFATMNEKQNMDEQLTNF